MKHTSNRIGEYMIQSQIEFDQRDWMDSRFCDLIEACESAYVKIASGRVFLCLESITFFCDLGEERQLQHALRDISKATYLQGGSYLKAAQLSAWLRGCFYTRDVTDGSAVDE